MRGIQTWYIFRRCCFWFAYCSSWTALCKLLGPHIQRKSVCDSTKYTMPTLGFATSTHTRVYRSIYVPRSHFSRCCKSLPVAKWKGVTVVLHNVSWTALGLLWFRDDLLGYARRNKTVNMKDFNSKYSTSSIFFINAGHVLRLWH